MERHAYLIIAHNEPEVLKTLLNALDVDWNDIYLHIDKRQPWLREKVKDFRPTHARLFILPNPIKVYWGHVSQIRVELLLLKASARNGPYAYYHLLSGCDLPIKPADTIRDFFHRHQGREFLGFWNSEEDQRDARRKVRYYYLLNRYKKRSAGWAHRVTSPLRNLLLGVQKALHVDRLRHADWELRKGFNWFSITEACCQYVLAHEDDVWRMFHHSLCGDELFLHTLIWNSPFRDRLFDIDDPQRGSMRAIDWQRGNPYVWQKKDTDYLLHSPYLFARKFSAATLSESLLSALRPR